MESFPPRCSLQTRQMNVIHCCTNMAGLMTPTKNTNQQTLMRIPPVVVNVRESESKSEIYNENKSKRERKKGRDKLTFYLTGRKCLCNIKDMKGSTGTSNCLAKTYTQLVALDDLSTTQIDAAFAKRNKFNLGLWRRARMVSNSRTRDVETTAPLSIFHPFFSQRLFWPHRTNLGVSLAMRDEAQILILKNGATDASKYKLTVTDCYLTLPYCTFLPELRTRWLSNISNLGLRRNLQVFKTVHFPLPKDASYARYPSIFSFSNLPQTLLIWIQPASTHTGDYKHNRYCFKNHGLDSLNLYLSGGPLKRNSFWHSMDLQKENGFYHHYWYKCMLSTFGKSAEDISLDSFYHDTFVFCVSLADNPRYRDDYGFTKDPADRLISFVNAAVLDCEVKFKAQMKVPMIISFCGLYDINAGYDVEGCPLAE